MKPRNRHPQKKKEQAFVSSGRFGEKLDVKVVKIVPRGLGLAFSEKLTVFVPLSVPEDELTVKIDEIKGRIAFASISSVNTASPMRVEPKCPYFGTCGGCDMQQMNYDAQLAAKSGIIRDALKRIGRIEYPDDIEMIASPREFGYRSRAQWQIDTRAKKAGYFKRGTHEVIDIESCPILEPALDQAFQELRKSLEWEGLWAEHLTVEAACVPDGSVSLYSAEIMEPTKEISFSGNGFRYTFSAQSFFQGNQHLIGRLIETALDGMAGKYAMDLYCGVGLFSLPIAKRFERVDGVEGNSAAVDLANKNAEAAGIENVKFHDMSVRAFLKGDVEMPDAVLLDPPRSGTEPGVIERIAELSPQTIAYVSCDPAILARDLRILLDRGYVIEKLTALDLFPQTHHVETVAILRRSKANFISSNSFN